jgi:hypothetical protein
MINNGNVNGSVASALIKVTNRTDGSNVGCRLSGPSPVRLAL